MYVYFTTFYTAQYNTIELNKFEVLSYGFINNFHHINIYNLNTTKWLIIQRFSFSSHLISSAARTVNIHQIINAYFNGECQRAILAVYIGLILNTSFNGCERLFLIEIALTQFELLGGLKPLLVNWMSHNWHYGAIDIIGRSETINYVKINFLGSQQAKEK